MSTTIKTAGASDSVAGGGPAVGRELISSGSEFESLIGYSRAVVTGEWVFVSGCTGYDYKTNTISPDVTEQTEQTLRNISLALREADSKMDEVVRVRYILPNRGDFPKAWGPLRKAFWEDGDGGDEDKTNGGSGRGARPAATMIVAGLMNEEMKIEIEVTARKGSGRRGRREKKKSAEGAGVGGGGGGDGDGEDGIIPPPL